MATDKITGTLAVQLMKQSRLYREFAWLAQTDITDILENL